MGREESVYCYEGKGECQRSETAFWQLSGTSAADSWQTQYMILSEIDILLSFSIYTSYWENRPTSGNLISEIKSRIVLAGILN